MDYKRMWIYLYEQIADEELKKTLYEIGVKELNGELIKFEIDERIKKIKKHLEENNLETAIKALQSVIDLKTSQYK